MLIVSRKLSEGSTRMPMAAEMGISRCRVSCSSDRSGSFISRLSGCRGMPGTVAICYRIPRPSTTRRFLLEPPDQQNRIVQLVRIDPVRRAVVAVGHRELQADVCRPVEVDLPARVGDHAVLLEIVPFREIFDLGPQPLRVADAVLRLQAEHRLGAGQIRRDHQTRATHPRQNARTDRTSRSRRTHSRHPC